jgi:hypothetical protein
VVPLFPSSSPAEPPERPTPGPIRSEGSIGLPPFQPDGPPVPFDLGGGIEAPAPAKPASSWPEHPGASDPSEHRDDVPWLQIPVGDEHDPAAGAPPWPGPSSNGHGPAPGASSASGSGSGDGPNGLNGLNGSSLLGGDVEPDGFVWPDDSAALGRTEAPDGLSLHEGPKRNGNGLSAGIGAGWPDTPRRDGSTTADPNPNEWPYVADRPARGAAPEAAAAPVVPLHDDRDRPRHDPVVDAGHDRVAGSRHDARHDHDAEAEADADISSGDRPAAAVAAPAASETGVARALPVIAVGVIVAVLAVGVAWVVMFGEDPGESANQSTTSAPPPGELRGDTGAGAGEEVTAVENPTGVQLDWGATDGPQVVLVLSDTQPPRTLPAKTGSALMVPASSLDPDLGYCFAVVPATDPLPTPADLAAGLDDGAIQPDACIRGASPASVLRQ